MHILVSSPFSSLSLLFSSPSTYNNMWSLNPDDSAHWVGECREESISGDALRLHGAVETLFLALLSSEYL